MIDAAEVHRLPIFRPLSRVRLDEALGVLMPCEVEAGQTLIVEGEADRSMFIVVEGELSVYVGGGHTEIARASKGELVGEMALFGVLDRRSATVRSRTNCRILVLDEAGLQFLRRKRSAVADLLEEAALLALANRLRKTNDYIGGLAQGEQLPADSASGLLGGFRGRSARRKAGPSPDPVAAMRDAPSFRDQEARIVEELAGRLESVFAAQGTRITREGQSDGPAYLLMSGRIDVFRATTEALSERVARIREGGLCGVVSMVDGGPRSATCVASQPSWLLVMPNELLFGGEQVLPRETMVFRRALLEALSRQLRLANAHLEFLDQQRRQEYLQTAYAKAWARRGTDQTPDPPPPPKRRWFGRGTNAEDEG